MPRYTPIEIPIPLAASQSDLIAFQWDRGQPSFTLIERSSGTSA
jgi:hypothetical protein